MTTEAGRFYTARFMLRWTADQHEDLAALLDGSPDDTRLRAVGIPLALGIVANYRMSLEHMAHEVARIACPHASSERVSFPVAIDLVAFRNMMLTRFPGLRVNVPRAWKVFRDAQAFHSANDDWLPVLHGLWNHTIPIRLGSRSTHPDGSAPNVHAPEAPPGPSTLVFDGGRPVDELLAEVAEQELRLVDAFERALADVADPEQVLDRRYRR